MFQSQEYIQRKHGKGLSDRREYLNKLVEEYKTTQDAESKQQVLAHLANFAYDPINYDNLWDFYAVDIFIEALSESDMKLKEFGAGGLANLCLEPRHHEYITANKETRDALVACLENTNADAVKINAITCLIQLVTKDNYQTLLSNQLEQHLKTISVSKASSTNLINLASLFLTDYYHY